VASKRSKSGTNSASGSSKRAKSKRSRRPAGAAYTDDDMSDEEYSYKGSSSRSAKGADFEHPSRAHRASAGGALSIKAPYNPVCCACYYHY
jgi:hypothetical protein